MQNPERGVAAYIVFQRGIIYTSSNFNTSQAYLFLGDVTLSPPDSQWKGFSSLNPCNWILGREWETKVWL